MNIVLRPQRDLDLKGAALLRQQLSKFIETSSPESVSYWVVDLSEVNEIDHFGLFALVEMRQLARRNRCHLRLCNLKRKIEAILEIAELNHCLSVWDRQKMEQKAKTLAKSQLLLC